MKVINEAYTGGKMRKGNEEIAEFCRKENKAHDRLVEAGFAPQGIGVDNLGRRAKVVTKRTDTSWEVWYFDTWQEAVEELLGKD